MTTSGVRGTASDPPPPPAGAHRIGRAPPLLPAPGRRRRRRCFPAHAHRWPRGRPLLAPTLDSNGGRRMPCFQQARRRTAAFDPVHEPRVACLSSAPLDPGDGAHTTPPIELRAMPAPLPLGERTLGVTFDASIRARRWAVNSAGSPPERRRAPPPGPDRARLTCTCAHVYTLDGARARARVRT